MIEFWKSRKFPLIMLIVLSCSCWILASDSVKPEKIFRHNRVSPEKLARVDLDNDEVQRALEDLRRRVPEYTGYLFLDVVVEVFKMLFLFFLSLLGQQHNVSGSSAPRTFPREGHTKN